MFRYFLLLILTLTCLGCASSYQPISQSSASEQENIRKQHIGFIRTMEAMPEPMPIIILRPTQPVS